MTFSVFPRFSSYPNYSLRRDMTHFCIPLRIDPLTSQQAKVRACVGVQRSPPSMNAAGC
jgi:hypothetical protein